MNIKIEDVKDGKPGEGTYINATVNDKRYMVYNHTRKIDKLLGYKGRSSIYHAQSYGGTDYHFPCGDWKLKEAILKAADEFERVNSAITEAAKGVV